ncbi:MAG: hypothetical protein U9M94_01065 [Patescibacteria group bacterium]|nr:hypothetical protein [Patescibacteria group bacterium]
MTKIDPKRLTTVNLRYGNTAKSLKVLAYANLSAKALYLFGRANSPSEIAKSVAKIIGIESVSVDLIKSGLDELKENKKIYFKDKKICLYEDLRKEIDKETEYSEKASEQVIEKHFPKTIKKSIVVAWFNDAIVDFFECHGDEWVQTTCKGTQKLINKIKTFDEIIQKSVKAHNLEKHEDILKNSFIGFLSSDDPEDQSYLTNVGYAMFTSRLVAADVGADLIALDELKNVTLLVDTNILFPLHLESHKLSSSFEALGTALKKIGVTIKYIDETKDEFERVWSARRADIMKSFEIYPPEVVKGADDDFISTAIVRGCKDKEDVEKFFDSILDVPKEFPSGPKLEILQDEKIENEIRMAKKDSELKVAIQNWCLKIRPFWNKQLKSKSALDHDSSLIHITEFEMKDDNNTFILTLDRSLQACCAERAGATKSLQQFI